MNHAVWMWLALVASHAFAAESLQFGADPASATWRFGAGASDCRLEHPIPDFGMVRFERALDQRLTFTIEPLQPLVGAGVIELSTVSPQWLRGDSDRREIARVESTYGTLRVGGEVAEDLLRALYVGRVPEAKQPSSGLRVSVSSVNFRSLYERFGDCSLGLQAIRFAAIEKTSVSFASSKQEIAREQHQRVKEVAAYVAADPRVVRVFVDGHADVSGKPRNNLALSKRRAEIVARELIAAGVPAEKILVRYHGGRFPVGSNDTVEGRAGNRRATIRLDRGADIAQR